MKNPLREFAPQTLSLCHIYSVQWEVIKYTTYAVGFKCEEIAIARICPIVNLCMIILRASATYIDSFTIIHIHLCNWATW